jgi:hypothetical protein
VAEADLALASHLAVPFHFVSPHVPDDDAPRRRTAGPGAADGSRCRPGRVHTAHAAKLNEQARR